jgi:tRNA/tmRNA/rRNA uracil-C5-methylase (TrmA/RlmC/RlmD family)
MGVLERELAYHEKLYSGFAQSHFARPAVRALRRHMVQRILKLTGAGPSTSVLSLGCGIGDTELLLAPHVGEVTGIDLSPAAIRQARADAARLGIANARFEQGSTAS